MSLIAATFALTGCGAQESTTPDLVVPAEELPSSEGEEVAELEAVFYPEGSAAQNEPYFRQVLTDAQVGSSRIAGEDVRQILIEAGFPADTVEITPDNSGLALPADSVAVAIAIEESCLIGQWGKDWLATQVVPILETGQCLIGETKSLD